MRYGAESGLRDATSQAYEEESLRLRRNWYITLSLLLIAVFAIFLPFWFMNFEGLKSHGGAHAHAAGPAATTVTVQKAIETIDKGGSIVAPAAAPMNESMPHTH